MRDAFDRLAEATSLLTAVTADATPHTAGAWVEMIASTAFTASAVALIAIGATATANTDTSVLADIGIGGSGSEVAIVESIPLGARPTKGFTEHRVPLSVPAGSRLSVRIRAAITVDTTNVQLRIAGGGLHGPSGYGRATTYGADTGTSNGVTLTTPGATNTKGAWTQIVAATTNPCRFLLAAPCLRAASTQLSVTGLIDIGVGGSGSEVVLIPDVYFDASSSEDLVSVAAAVPVNLPAGVRLSARYQGSATNAGPAVILIGLD